MRTTETRPERALEVHVCFDGAVLGVHHLLSGQSLTLGPAVERPARQPDYAVSALHTRLEVASFGAVPCVAFPMDATGEVLLPDGGRRTLAQLQDSGLCESVQGAFRYALPDGAQALLLVAGLEITVREGALPARSVPRPAPFQWRELRYTAASLLGGALVVGMALLAPPDPHALASTDLSLLNNEALQTRFIPPAVEVKLPVPTGEGDSGPQKPVKGPVAAAGSPRSHRHVVTMVPHPAGPTQKSGDDLMSEVRRAGVLGMIGQMKAQGAMRDLLDTGKSALGQDADAVLAGLNAVHEDVGWGQNGGSLMQVGPGTGGGCVGADCGTIAMRWDRICTGPNCGSGPGGPGGHRPGRLPGLEHKAGTPPDPIVGIGQVSVGLDKDTVRRVIRSRMAEFKFCYEQQLLRAPDLSGRVVMSFAIGHDGRVLAAGPRESTMNNPAVLGCLSKAVQRLSFPQPQGASVVQVSYPFVFQAAGH